MGKVSSVYSLLVFQHIPNFQIIESYVAAIRQMLLARQQLTSIKDAPCNLTLYVKTALPDFVLPKYLRRGIRRVRAAYLGNPENIRAKRAECHRGRGRRAAPAHASVPARILREFPTMAFTATEMDARFRGGGREPRSLRVAITHYWFNGYGGGERVVEALAEVFPQADFFSLIAAKEHALPALRGRRLTTSFVGARSRAKPWHRHFLPLYPIALEQFDLSAYDLVNASWSGPAKGVITSPQTCHICYCHSPMRYIWDLYPRIPQEHESRNSREFLCHRSLHESMGLEHGGKGGSFRSQFSLHCSTHSQVLPA